MNNIRINTQDTNSLGNADHDRWWRNVENAKNAKNNLEMDVIPGLVVRFPGHISLATA